MPCTTTAVNDEEDVFLYIYWHALLEGSRGNSWLVYINSSTERRREREREELVLMCPLVFPLIA